MTEEQKAAPIIAIDYDGTITTNIPFWENFIKQAEEAAFRVCIVTWRTHEELHSGKSMEPIDDRITDVCHWIIPTARTGKAEFCARYNIFPAIWIEDNPLAIFAGQNAINEVIHETTESGLIVPRTGEQQ